jgi:flagellar hook assembly protein FlgD
MNGRDHTSSPSRVSQATASREADPGTRIRFDLPVSTHVTLQIFDLFGRQVRRLIQAEVSAGRHDIGWDGRQGSG